ncbi:MAG: glutamate synthase subunit beta [Actinobacteria bacterium]|nr:glutamate synthase subunit beta [Actinomycetota bacterium]
MGKAGGYLLHNRENHTNDSQNERLKNYDEFARLLSTEEQRVQASRCMDCGVAFCQAGLTIKGHTTGCPLHNLIPEWNDLVYRGDWAEAYARLSQTNPFPEFTGRVCPALCEVACNLGLNYTATTIKDNERAIIDEAFTAGIVEPSTPATRTDKQVCVIGSGPAGLAAAEHLNRMGHNVTVMERHDRCGGLLMYGIPNMKLDKDIIERRIDLMKKSGITFLTNKEVATKEDADSLLASYEAIVLATGATVARDLLVPGRDLKGVHFAVDYLTNATKLLLNPEHEGDEGLSAHGKNVIVVGGGDTGVDCIATALRQGAKSVIQLDIHRLPPQVRTSSNPWPEWPNTYTQDYGHIEAESITGEDPRIWASTVKELFGNEDGSVSKVMVAEVLKRDGSNITYGDGQLFDCDMVLIALGFSGPEQNVIDAFGLEKTSRNFPAPRSKEGLDRFRSSNDKVFIAGDMRRGQSLVVWAIEEGLECAESINAMLS